MAATLSLWILLLPCIMCLPYLAGDHHAACVCTSKCKPEIHITKGHGGHGHHGHHGHNGGRRGVGSAAAPSQLWWCPLLIGSPCYHLRFPNTPIQQSTWLDGYRYCKELGPTSNLTYFDSDEEFDLVVKWLRTQFVLPVRPNWLIWTSGVIDPLIPIQPAAYKWNSTNRPININKWQSTAPRSKPCVGMNPNSDFQLLDHDCNVATGTFYTGWLCRRPPY